MRGSASPALLRWLVVGLLITFPVASHAQNVADEPTIYRADILGENGSSFTGRCFLFLPCLQQAVNLMCDELAGGLMPETVEIFDFGPIIGESDLMTFPFTGESSVSRTIPDPTGRLTKALGAGALGLRFSTSAGPEGQGTFSRADQTLTTYLLDPIQGDENLIGEGTIATILDPPWVGLDFQYDLRSPVDEITLTLGTLDDPGPPLIRLLLGGEEGSLFSFFQPFPTGTINSINTGPTNLQVYGGTNQIGGNNQLCHSGGLTACLGSGANAKRWRVKVEGDHIFTRVAPATPNQDGPVSITSVEFSGTSGTRSRHLTVTIVDRCTTDGTITVSGLGLINLDLEIVVTDTQTGMDFRVPLAPVGGDPTDYWFGQESYPCN